MQSVCYSSLGASVSMITSNPHNIKSICCNLPRIECQFLLLPEHLDSREKFGFLLQRWPNTFLVSFLSSIRMQDPLLLGSWWRLWSGQHCRKCTLGSWLCGRRVLGLLWALALREDSRAPRQLYLALSFRLNLFSHYTAGWIPAHRHFTMGCQETVSWMNTLILWILYWQKSYDSYSSYRQK